MLLITGTRLNHRVVIPSTHMAAAAAHRMARARLLSLAAQWLRLVLTAAAGRWLAAVCAARARWAAADTASPPFLWRSRNPSCPPGGPPAAAAAAAAPARPQPTGASADAPPPLPSPEQLAAAIRRRRSVFPQHYTGARVPAHTIETMLQAADWAPSHGRTEPWRFVVLGRRGIEELQDVTEAATRRLLAGDPEQLQVGVLVVVE